MMKHLASTPSLWSTSLLARSCRAAIHLQLHTKPRIATSTKTIKSKAPSTVPWGTPDRLIAPASKSPPSPPTVTQRWAVAARMLWRSVGQRGSALIRPGLGTTSTFPWTLATGMPLWATAPAAACPPAAGCPTSPPASPSPTSTMTWRRSWTRPPLVSPSAPRWRLRYRLQGVAAAPLEWRSGSSSTSNLWPSHRPSRLTNPPTSPRAPPRGTRHAPASQTRTGSTHDPHRGPPPDPRPRVGRDATPAPMSTRAPPPLIARPARPQVTLPGAAWPRTPG